MLIRRHDGMPQSCDALLSDVIKACLIRDGNIDKVTQLETDGGKKTFLEKFHFVRSGEAVSAR